MQKQCKRCGTCCKKGGPILHREDIALMDNTTLSLENLITIRIGEQAYNPITDTVEPAECELIKIAGKGAQWECLFYENADSSCTIHSSRPLECRELECWNTGKIKAVIGQNCLSRSDLLGSDDPVREYMNLHEEKCSYREIHSLLSDISNNQSQDSIKTLTSLIQTDLLVRSKATALFQLSLQKELFLFGRPLFQAVHYPGLLIRLEGSTVVLEYSASETD